MPDCTCGFCTLPLSSDVKSAVYLSIQEADVRPNDWAQHKTAELDPRRVSRVDHGTGQVWLYLTGGEFGPMPLSNYEYDREV